MAGHDLISSFLRSSHRPISKAEDAQFKSPDSMQFYDRELQRLRYKNLQRHQ
jgi:hypothetical protein